MIHKTQGIVLTQYKYTDNKRIVNILTKSAGKKSFIIFNSRGKKNISNLFQPSFILNLEFSERNNAKLLNIKEASLFQPYNTIPYSPEKMSINFFLVEVLNKIIVEELVDERLFDFITNSFILLDNCERPANFHISFLLQLSVYVGIMPVMNYSDKNKFFDIREGKFTSRFIMGYTIDEFSSKKIAEITDAGIDGFKDVSMNRQTRAIILNKLLDFYAYHFSTVNNIKSLEVLQELFNIGITT